MKKFKNTLFTITLVTIAMLSVGCVRKMTEEEKYHPSEVLSEEMAGTSEQELEYKAEYAEKDGFYCLDGDFTCEGSHFAYDHPYYWDKSWEHSENGYVIEYYNGETMEVFDYKNDEVTDIKKILEENPELDFAFPKNGSNKDTEIYYVEGGNEYYQYDYRDYTPYDIFFVNEYAYEWYLTGGTGKVMNGGAYQDLPTLEQYLESHNVENIGTLYGSSVSQYLESDEEKLNAFLQTNVATELKKINTECTFRDILDKIDNFESLTEDEQTALAIFLYDYSGAAGYLEKEDDGTPVGYVELFIKKYGYDKKMEIFRIAKKILGLAVFGDD